MTPKQLSRRDFLKLSGLALGGAALTCSGLGYDVTLREGGAAGGGWGGWGRWVSRG
jgi:hypothetical protein